MGSKYNINELLDLRKELENKIAEKLNFDAQSLTYVEDKYTDYTNDKNNRTLTVRAKISLNEYTSEIFNLLDKLADVKTAIQVYNTNNILEDLNKRESIRKKIKFLEKIKSLIPTEVKHFRSITRTDEKNATVEIREQKIEPMFDIKDIEKQYDQFAAQERKLNTDIQRKNLNAEIELE